MIKIDFIFGLSLCISFAITLVFSLWVFYNYKCRKGDELYDQASYIKQCIYCTYIYFVFNDENYVTCPKCKSIQKFT